jgi:methionyl-tRNA synthetase
LVFNSLLEENDKKNILDNLYFIIKNNFLDKNNDKKISKLELLDFSDSLSKEFTKNIQKYRSSTKVKELINIQEKLEKYIEEDILTENLSLNIEV